MSVETQAVRRETAQATRQDQAMLWVGIAFSTLVTGLIWWLGPRLAAVPHWPDSGAAWYYWRLMEPDTAARVSAWGMYLVHQVAIWWLIFSAQRMKARTGLRYSTRLYWFNWAALGVNALFAFLHLFQTHVWYGGLAEDVSIWSSQWSVILLLVLVVLMENQRRGLVFGKKVGWMKRAGSFVRTYHGYLFAWAIVYTYWYHPTEATFGHLLGFFYTFLLMLQGSLFFTRVHLNKWWGWTLETLVLVHGATVAVLQGNGMWPMFAFGFAGVLVLTTIHGLGLPRWMRWGALALYVGLALWVYGSRDNLAGIYQIAWIPATYYVVVFALAGLISLGLWLAARLRPAPVGGD